MLEALPALGGERGEDEHKGREQGHRDAGAGPHPSAQCGGDEQQRGEWGEHDDAVDEQGVDGDAADVVHR